MQSVDGQTVDGQTAETGEDRVDVDFVTQVWPVLQRRCLKCHNADKSEGGLRLESRKLAELGGHTGITVLGDSPDESE